MIDPAVFSWRFLSVWKRNLVVYKKIWKVNFLTPLFEPLFYILAFGLGFSGLIGKVHYDGVELSYTAFIAPALIATAVMWNAFFETTYASFVRMYFQKTFDGMLATPLSLEEIIIAEIAWSATKSAGAATIMLLVLGLMGFIHFPMGLLLIPYGIFRRVGIRRHRHVLYGDNPDHRYVQSTHISFYYTDVFVQRHLFSCFQSAGLGAARCIGFSPVSSGRTGPSFQHRNL